MQRYAACRIHNLSNLLDVLPMGGNGSPQRLITMQILGLGEMPPSESIMPRQLDGWEDIFLVTLDRKMSTFSFCQTQNHS
jgi:hypothetical protein